MELPFDLKAGDVFVGLKRWTVGVIDRCDRCDGRLESHFATRRERPWYRIKISLFTAALLVPLG